MYFLAILHGRAIVVVLLRNFLKSFLKKSSIHWSRETLFHPFYIGCNILKCLFSFSRALFSFRSLNNIYINENVDNMFSLSLQLNDAKQRPIHFTDRSIKQASLQHIDISNNLKHEFNTTGNEKA